ncbi:MAG: class I SAM-dependent methyltransferase [Woeseia sp.]
MTTQNFKDHFSGHAAAYASARPTYPDALFEFLASSCRARDCAWDCATGNGQAALQLARHFTKVIATDASEQQVLASTPHERISYRVAAAESSGLADASVDLVTVAQALHWFDVDQFFVEAARVLTSGGVLAVWGYGLCQVTPAVDRIVLDLYDELDPYWPAERSIVDSGYSGISLPFAALDCPVFSMHVDWDAAAMLAYLETWSATQRCRADTGREPVKAIAAALRAAWGQGSRAVHWPLFLKASRQN